MSTLVVVASFEIKSGEEDRFKRVLVTLGVQACIENEPACTLLWTHQDTDDPSRFLLYEQWADRASFEASFDHSWRETYMKETEHLWASPRVTTTWKLVGEPVPEPPAPRRSEEP